MNNVADIVTRLGILAVALALCALKFIYTLTLEIHATGGGAFYTLLIHDVYVVMSVWTILLATLVMTTGVANVKDMGSLTFLHTSYFLTMGVVALFSLLNDGIAMLHTSGAHTAILMIQIGLEFAIVIAMSQQLRAVMKTVSDRVGRATVTFAVLLALGSVTVAHAETNLHAHANSDGSLDVVLKDSDTGRSMNTVLPAARVRQFLAYLAQHNMVADARPISAPSPVETKAEGCGLGGFFSGRC